MLIHLNRERFRGQVPALNGRTVSPTCAIVILHFPLRSSMDLSLVFLAGIFGSLHCVGMCGAIVLAYSTVPEADTTGSTLLSSLPSHFAYNGGRVLSYTLIGGLAGFIGGVLGSVQVLGTWVALFAGLIMVLTGLLMLGLFPRVRLWRGTDQTRLRRLHLHAAANLLTLRSLESKFYIGLLTPFLPCGLLYSMFVRAAASGSMIDGALVMLAFGAGIVPSLMLTGMASAFLGTKLRQFASTLAAVTIIVMGITMILRGAGVPFPFMQDHGHHGERGDGMQEAQTYR